jgi:sec-independent protein translocase protein TatB
MFEVGFSEILLIFAIALLVLGPEKLPKLAADLGRWAGRARAMARQLRTQLEQEVQYDPMKDAPAPARTIHSPAVVPAAAAAPAPDAIQESSAAPAAAAAAVTEPAPAAMGGNDEPKPA